MQQKEIKDNPIVALMKERYHDFFFNDHCKRFILHVGKTGSGKTYQAVKRLKESGNGVYLSPLRLLAWEVYEKLNAEGCPCNLVTGEEQVQMNGASVTSSTIEMLNFSKSYEVVIIDEAFMITDKERGKSWMKAIFNCRAKEAHIILNEESLELFEGLLNATDKNFEIRRYERLHTFRFSDNPFKLSEKIKPKGVFVTFSRIDVLIAKMQLEDLGKNVSILYGNLPPEIKKIQISNFISGKSDVLVTTDVIGMGINVPCDYLIFLTSEKFDGVKRRKLNSTEVKQISGRTGRYGVSGDNCYVSCLYKLELEYIKETYEHKTKPTQGYVGIDLDIFSSFPDDVKIPKRITTFHEADFIPERIKPFVVKEVTQKFVENLMVMNYAKFDLFTTWTFMTAPVKMNNQSYFAKLTHSYTDRGLIPPEIPLVPVSEAKYLEDKISEIELYLNLTRNLRFDTLEKMNVQKRKQELIELLDKVLLDKRLMRKKKCKGCEKLLDIQNSYNWCHKCYEDNFGW